MKKPIEYFKKILPEPENYRTYSPGLYFYPDYYNAYVCANISQLCYKSSVGAKHTDEDYKDAVYETLKLWGWSSEDALKTIFINSREIPNEDGLSVPGTQGLVLFYENTAFIAFRGSEKKLNDWLTNVNTRKVKSPHVPGNVHSGFLNAFEAIIPDRDNKNDDKSKEADFEQKPASLFEEVIGQLSTMEAIWLTGHSLGGAIASIAASYLLKRRIPESRIYIYTFGAPRVGDAEYRKYMNSKFTYRYWRFLHNHDIVPDVPFPGVFPFMARFLFIGFSRDGCMLRLKREKDKEEKEVLRLIYHDGTRKIFKSYKGITAKHHSIGAYCERLQNQAHLTDSNLPVMKYSEMLSNITLGTTEEETNIIQLQLDLSKLRKWFWLLLLLQLGLLGLVSWLILEKNSPTTIQPQPSAIIKRK